VRKFIAITLLIFALLQLGFRGMQRKCGTSCRCGIRVGLLRISRVELGQQPYDMNNVVATWRDTNLFVDRDVSSGPPFTRRRHCLMIGAAGAAAGASRMIAWLAITIARSHFSSSPGDMAGLTWGE